MIDDLKPYPEYKDTAIPWVGLVPTNWEIERGRWLFRKVARPTNVRDEVITCFRDGAVTLRKNRRTRGFTESIKEIGYQGIRRGDLVIHAMDAFAGAIGVSDSDGKGTPVYAVCEPLAGVNSYFFAHAIREMARSAWILSLSRGIRERSTDFRFETFGSQWLPVPPLPEQLAIVRFLDHADRLIKKYIRAKQKLIKLLEEQKQAIIHQAVTRGLEPNVKLKPSGVEWLGEVPEGWVVSRFKTLIHRIEQGVSPQAENRIATPDSWGVLKAGCVNGGIFRPEQHKRLPKSYIVDKDLAVGCGDVLISRACGSPSLVGSVGRVERLDYNLILSDKTFRPVFRASVDPDFMVCVMNSRYYRSQVEQAISGAEGLASNLPLSELVTFIFAIPPLTVQRLLANEINGATATVRETVERTATELSLLREYRTRLIADVVTGKLDVRAAAAALPELLDDAGATAAVDEAGEEEDDSGVDDGDAGELES